MAAAAVGVVAGTAAAMGEAAAETVEETETGVAETEAVGVGVLACCGRAARVGYASVSSTRLSFSSPAPPVF